jgi:hypothetical protein
MCRFTGRLLDLAAEKEQSLHANGFSPQLSLMCIFKLPALLAGNDHSVTALERLVSRVHRLITASQVICHPASVQAHTSIMMPRF